MGGNNVKELSFCATHPVMAFVHGEGTDLRLPELTKAMLKPGTAG